MLEIDLATDSGWCTTALVVLQLPSAHLLPHKNNKALKKRVFLLQPSKKDRKRAMQQKPVCQALKCQHKGLRSQLKNQ